MFCLNNIYKAIEARCCFGYLAVIGGIFVCIMVGLNITYYELVTRKGNQDIPSTYASFKSLTLTFNLHFIEFLAYFTTNYFGLVVRVVCCLVLFVSLVAGASRK
ncbi:hypothetical protein EDC96DRAFT_234464 [Choanephora cucurbitarum]|nr:hypothetical protein EDC96DRAFT_234464 [Choanephora cucurbitarum]